MSQAGSLVTSGGGGGGTVTSVTGGTGILVTNPTTTPVVNLLTVSSSLGGTGVSMPNAHTIPIAEGSSNYNFLGPLTNGQLLIGSTGNDPVPATLTAGSGISITNNPGSISIAATNAGTVTSVGAGTGINVTGTAAAPIVNLTIPVVEIDGGTNQTTYTKGDILYASAANTLSKLGIGSAGNFLTVSSGIPAWTSNNTITGTTTQYDVIVGAGTNSVGSVGPGSSGQVLQSGGNAANPAYSTATYPSTATGTGTILRADGTNWSATTTTYPNTNAINTLLYASAANVMSALATATTAVLTTSAGVPTWASKLSLALGGTNASLTASNGGIFYSTASAGAILSGTATAGQLLTSGASTTPAWTTSTYPATNAINTLLYASSANVMGALSTANNGTLITGTTGIPSWLANGTTGQILTATTGSPPSWAAAPSSGITGTTTQYDVIVGAGTNSVGSVGTGSAGQVLQSGGNAANPAYSTPTYPSASGGVGTILRSDGTNNVYTTATYPATTTSQQLLYSSATSVVGGLALPTIPGSHVEYTGTTTQYANPFQEVRIVDYFLFPNLNGGNVYSQVVWNTNTSGGQATNSGAFLTSGYPGGIQLNTQASSTGEANMFLGNTSSTTGAMILGGGSIDLYWVFQLPTLSNSSQRYTIQLGFGDTNGSSQANGVYLTYSDNINSGNWQGVTFSSSSSSTVNGATAGATGFNTIRINVNAAASTITYYVNGVSQGTLSAHIPTTTISPYALIVKSIGSTQSNLNLSMFYMYQNLTSSR